MTTETPIQDNKILTSTSSESYKVLLTQIDLEAEDVNADRDELVQRLKKIHMKFEGEKNPEILMSLARNCFRASTFAFVKGLKEEERNYLMEADGYIKKVLAKDDKNYQSHALAAFISGRLYRFLGIREAIARAYYMQSHLEQAIKLNNKEGGVWYSYGRWYFELSKLSWIERKLASAYLGKQMKATYQDSLNSFLEADKREPNRIATCFWIAKCHIALKNDEKAIQAINAAVTCKYVDEEDLTIQRELLTLRETYTSFR